MKLTTQRYYTPSGRSIQAKGIEPDIEIRQARLEYVEGPDRHEGDLRGALLNDQDNGESAGEEDSEAAPDGEEDYQLIRALDLLRGIALSRNIGN